MAGIRVNTGVKRIEVNDNGDFITLNLSDNAFLDRFFALYNNVQRVAEESAAREAAVREKYAGGDENALLRELFSLYKEASERMMAEVDALFGEDTCRRVFGDITPGFELYLDFFEQLLPYLREFAGEKAQRMSRYSAARTGNV